MKCLSVLPLLWSCSQSGVKQASLKQVLDQGRIVAGKPVPELRPIDKAKFKSQSSYYGIEAMTPFEPEGRGVRWTLMDTEAIDAVDESQLMDEAMRLIAEKNPLLLLGATDLATPGTIVTSSETIVSVIFDRVYRDIPVRDAYVQVVFVRDRLQRWRPREIVNNGHGDISVTNLSAPDASWEDVRAQLPETLQDLTVTARRRVILGTIIPEKSPQMPGTTTRLQTPRFTLATEFSAIGSTMTKHTMTIENGSQQILEAYRDEYSASPAVVRARVIDGSYISSKMTDRTLPLTSLSSGGAAALTTDEFGQLTGELGANVTVQLNSLRVKVMKESSNTPASFSVLSAKDQGSGDVLISTQGEALTALNLYATIMAVNSFVRRHIRANQAEILDVAPTALYNVNGECNASYSSGANVIRMYRSSSRCADTSLINDIAAHEWGHGLDFYTGSQKGITDGAFSEGIGDILASYWQKDPRIGPGFFIGQQQGLRTVEHNLRYPNDIKNQVHEDGKIIGGTFWDLRKDLVKRYGELRGSWHAEKLFLRHLLDTNRFLDSYMSVLRLDDNDQNSQTKAPNHCLINAAFAKHGLATSENCIDPEPRPQWTNEINIAIKEQGGGNVTLLASIADPSVQNMGFCVVTGVSPFSTDPVDSESAPYRQCFEAGQWTETVQSAVQMGGRGLFEGKTSFLLDTQTRVLVATLGPDSKPVKAREFRLVKNRAQ